MTIYVYKLCLIYVDHVGEGMPRENERGREKERERERERERILGDKS